MSNVVGTKVVGVTTGVGSSLNSGNGVLVAVEGGMLNGARVLDDVDADGAEDEEGRSPKADSGTTCVMNDVGSDRAMRNSPAWVKPSSSNCGAIWPVRMSVKLVG